MSKLVQKWALGLYHLTKKVQEACMYNKYEQRAKASRNRTSVRGHPRNFIGPGTLVLRFCSSHPPLYLAFCEAVECELSRWIFGSRFAVNLRRLNRELGERVILGYGLNRKFLFTHSHFKDVTDYGHTVWV